jgi:hypothetical protein
MSVKQNTALTGLIVALVFVSGCGPSKLLPEPGPGQNHGLQDRREFRIYIYADPTQQGQCLVDWPEVTLWRNHKHKVKWVSDDRKAYTVDFNPDQSSNPPPPQGQGRGNPFNGGSNGKFDVPANGEKSSDDLISTSQGYYPYWIKDANGTVCKKASDPDPGVYVK